MKLNFGGVGSVMSGKLRIGILDKLEVDKLDSGEVGTGEMGFWLSGIWRSGKWQSGILVKWDSPKIFTNYNWKI